MITHSLSTEYVLVVYGVHPTSRLCPAIHMTNCSDVRIENVNVHGASVKVEKYLGDREFICEKQQTILQQVANSKMSSMSSVQHSQRSKIILLAFEGKLNRFAGPILLDLYWPSAESPDGSTSPHLEGKLGKQSKG